MKIATALAAATIATAGALGVASAPPAAATGYPVAQSFGTSEDLVDGAGTIVQSWTINNLAPSTDTIGWPVRGRLWAADATVRATRGCPEPLVSNFNARARNGNTYQHLWAAFAPAGINPRTICQGDQTTGKLYFDVWGQEPDSVVYTALGQDLLLWVK